jgi:transglutaminase-like putative cysteine protease
LLGFITGTWLAVTRIRARRAAAIASFLGIVLLVILAGRLTPPFHLIVREIGYTVDWIKLKQQGMIGWPLPLGSTVTFVWQQLSLFGSRLLWWGQAVAIGRPVQDNIVFLLLTSLLAWVISFFAGWQIYRHRSAVVGLMPGSAAMTLLAFYIGGMAVFYLLAYLICTLSLMAICYMWVRRSRWEKTSTDYPGEMGTELALAVAPGLFMILTLALVFPMVYPHRLREVFWQLLEGPWSQVEEVTERLFGPIEGGYSAGIPGDIYGTGLSGEMPSAHLLGGRPDLDETIVFYVSTNDPPPPPPEPEAQLPQSSPTRYWRGTTYEIYTGQGWTTGPLESQNIGPFQSLEAGSQSSTIPTHQATGSLVQEFVRARPEDIRIYAANRPVQLDQPVESWWRAYGDLAHLTGKLERYTVVSHPPGPTINELRASSLITQNLKLGDAERYLNLPPNLPQRIQDLAHQVVGDAPTPYDKTRAIEAFLRAYPYNLDLPDPPTDRDLVDYFLFDLQEGYCDYYASAMVVMARAVGVPARLASGYAQGAYNHELGRWVVTEKDGHSWVEVYFEGIGWVEFEPTAGLPALERPGGTGLAPVGLPPIPRRALLSWRGIPWPLLVLAVVLLVLTAVLIWIWRPKKGAHMPATDLVRDRHARLLRWGKRLGHPMQDGQTPNDYASALGAALRERGQRPSWSQVRKASEGIQPDLEYLTASFVRAQYSPRPIDNWEGRQIGALWMRLRRRLWWLWLSR